MSVAARRSEPPQRLFAFLRAINVGGHVVTMEALRKYFVALGFKNVETFIASGNVIFEAPSKDAAALQGRIEAHLRKALGYEVRTFLRTGQEIAAIVRYQAFKPAQIEAAAALNVAFLDQPSKAAPTKALLAMKTQVDDFHVHGREAYWLCKTRQSESTFFKVGFEKALGVPVTVRNMNTIVRLEARYGRS